jgi:hypothetical protein
MPSGQAKLGTAGRFAIVESHWVLIGRIRPRTTQDCINFIRNNL